MSNNTGESRELSLENAFYLYKDSIQELLNDNSNLTAKCIGNNYCIWCNNKEIIASWYLIELPGCCGVVVSTRANVIYRLRHFGLGTILNKLRITQATYMGYGQIICTVQKKNINQIKILDKNNWTLTSEFVNPRTGNSICSYKYDL